MFDTVMVFVHDGVYSANSGAGTENYRFIQELPKHIGSASLVVCPITITRSHDDFNMSWYNRVISVLQQVNGRIVQVHNGSTGNVRYGNISYWKNSSQEATKIVKNELLNTNGRVCVISFDTPFIGLMRNLADMDRVTHVHVPHSTAYIHEPQNKERVLYETESFLAGVSSNTYIGSIGSYMQSHLVSRYGVHPDTIVPIHNGVCVDEYVEYSADEINDTFDKYNLDIQKPLVIAFGRSNEYKGYHILLEALYHMPSPRPQFFILAASSADHNHEYNNKLKKLAKDYKLDGSFEFTFDWHTPRIFLQSPNLLSLVVPSFSEPFGLLPAEYYADPCSRGVLVVSNVGGLREQVVHNSSGLLFDSGDTNALAECLNQVIRLSDSQKKALKEVGYVNTMKNYNYQKNISNFFDCITKV